MRLIDRYILRSLITNYVIAVAVMISLYVVLDMFVNMDEFTEQDSPIAVVLANLVSYYVPSTFLYFAQLSGVITLFACMATLARMRRLNEMTAILASGVSLHRVAAPIIAFGLATTTLLVIDTELVIPSVAHLLARDHDDADGKRAYEVLFLHDRDGALLSARQFHPTRHDLQGLLVLARDENGEATQILEADHAIWSPPGPTQPVGRWQLERGSLTSRVRTDRPWDLGPTERKQVELVDYYESDLSPEAIQLRQAEGWIGFLSLSQLRELQDNESADQTAIIRAKHARVVAPIMGMVLLLLGLPFFLSRSPANVIGDAGRCMVVCGLCYGSSFVAESVRSASTSALPSWIPIFVFATLAVILIDRIRT